MFRKQAVACGEIEGGATKDEEPHFEQFTPTVIVIYVMLMCGMLLCLYFLYDYMGMHSIFVKIGNSIKVTIIKTSVNLF